jgi:hypothetical protein
MKRILPLFVIIITISLSSTAWSQGVFRFSQRLQHRAPLALPPTGMSSANAKFPQVHYTLNRVAGFRPGQRGGVAVPKPLASSQQPIFTQFHYPAGVGPVMTNVPLPTQNPSFDVDHSMPGVDAFDYLGVSGGLQSGTNAPLLTEQAAAQEIGQLYETERSRITQLLPPPEPARKPNIVPPGFSGQAENVASAKLSRFTKKSGQDVAEPIAVLPSPMIIEGPALFEPPMQPLDDSQVAGDLPFGDLFDEEDKENEIGNDPFGFE